MQSILSLAFVLLATLAHATDEEATPLIDEPCSVGICCDTCSAGGDGITSCRGCEAEGQDGCATGQTHLECPPGSCYNGGQNLQYGSFGNEGCSP